MSARPATLAALVEEFSKLPIRFELVDVREVCRVLGFRHIPRAYEAKKKGLLTAPITQGRNVRWPAHEIQAIAAARIAGLTDEHIPQLVDALHAARANILQQASR